MRLGPVLAVFGMVALGGCAGRAPQGALALCGSLLCTPAERAQLAQALGLPSLDPPPASGASYRVFAVDPYRKPLPAMLFTGGSDAAQVEVRQARPGANPLLLHASLSSAVWIRVERAYLKMDTRLSREALLWRLSHPFGGRRGCSCMDGVSYELIVSAHGESAREWGDGCGDAGADAASDMALIAMTAIPSCRGASRTGMATQELEQCFPAADRAAGRS